MADDSNPHSGSDSAPAANIAPSPKPDSPSSQGHKPVFLTGEIPVHIRKMAVPMGWGILAMVAASLVDAYFLGRLGTLHLAAITFTFPVVTLLSNLTLGLGTGVSSILARSLGGSEPNIVRQQSICAILLSLILVGFLSFVGYLTIDPLFKALGAGPESLQLIRDYMVIFYASMVFLVVPMTGNFILRAAGDARTAGFLMIGSAILSMILDPILIFGMFGLPRLEIQGAAYAAAIARGAAFVFMIYVLWFRKRLVTFVLPPFKQILEIWWDILRVGGPLAGSNMVAPVILAVITGLLASFGEPVVAGFGVAARIEALALIPLMAMSSGIGPIVGQNFGAGQIARVFEVIRSAGKFSVYYGVAAGLFFLAFHRFLPRLFDSNPEVIESAAWYLLMTSFGFTAIGVSMAIGASYNGMGDPKPSVAIILGRTAVVFLPLAFLGAYLLGPLGVYMGGAIANVVVGALAWRWVQGRRDLWIHRNSSDAA